MANDRMFEAYMALRRSLARTVSRIVPRPEIEDIVQETYVRACLIETAEGIRYPRSFLYRVARNLALDHIRRTESRPAISLDEDEAAQALPELLQPSVDVSEQLATRQEFELFCQAVAQLPMQCRRVFVLRKVYGYSQREIATELNLSENTVEKHIAYGIKRCSQFMVARTGGGRVPAESAGSRVAQRGKP